MKAKNTKESGKEKEKALNTLTHVAVLESTSGTTAVIKDLGAPGGRPPGPENGGDVSGFEKALDQAVGQKADVIIGLLPCLWSRRGRRC